MSDFNVGELVTGVKGSFYHGQRLHFTRHCNGSVMDDMCYVQGLDRHEFPVGLDEIMHMRDMVQEKTHQIKHDCIEYPATKEQYDRYQALIDEVTA